MIYINILLIAVIFVIGIDKLEFDGVIANWLYKKTTGRTSEDRRLPKPFSCSTCSTHWTGLIYLLITANLTIPNYTYLLAISFLTPTINLVITLVETSLNNIIGKLIDKCSSRNNNIQD